MFFCFGTMFKLILALHSVNNKALIGIMVTLNFAITGREKSEISSLSRNVE